MDKRYWFWVCLILFLLICKLFAPKIDRGLDFWSPTRNWWRKSNHNDRLSFWRTSHLYSQFLPVSCSMWYVLCMDAYSRETCSSQKLWHDSASCKDFVSWNIHCKPFNIYTTSSLATYDYFSFLCAIIHCVKNFTTCWLLLKDIIID